MGDSLEKIRRLDDQIGFHFAYDYLGLVAYRSGDAAEAARLHQESLTRASRMAFGFGEAMAHARLGHALAASGKTEAAEEHLRTALRSALEMEASPVALEAIAGLARLGASADERAAGRLFSLIVEHPAAQAATQARVREYLARLDKRGPRLRRHTKPFPLRELEEIVTRIAQRTREDAGKAG